MKILHVTPHLGGGVGKAHAAISAVLPKSIEQTFLLLEVPRDRGYADVIAASGARVVVGGLGQVAQMAREADIVQFEFWNHPRLYECLARGDLPAMRSVFWSHISGLFNPVIAPGLMQAAGRFVFTTPASLEAPGITPSEKISVINSGFGFGDAPPRHRTNAPSIAYLGTVDFVKMHPGFFDVIDALQGHDIRVPVWGAVANDVVHRAKTMRHPERIVFRGQTADPKTALAGSDIFFYPLQPDHYGTAENALIEAMSLGLAPVVLNNPSELAIISDGVTGLVAHSIEECTSHLQMLLTSPERRATIGQAAMQNVVKTRTPEISARQFTDLWQGLLLEPARDCDFRSAIGSTPADWFLTTQALPGAVWNGADERGPNSSKGTLAHFESAFPGDASLAMLRHLPRSSEN
jgi:glycosyltransferase involved in cell wall biosynthesis